MMVRATHRRARLAAMIAAGLGWSVPGTAGEADAGLTVEQGRTAQWEYQQHKQLAAALAALKPQRPGVVDAYVIAIGLDSDPVFGREAAEASRVLARRFDAAGRTILLAAGEGAGTAAAANGSPGNLAIALGGVAARLDPKEDVLILFTTSHGGPVNGLSYRDGVNGYGMIGPKRMADLLDGLGIKRRMTIISACFSGIFVPKLASDDSVIVTAASETTTSFGCAATNDWTYFGDAFINSALRQPLPFGTVVKQAFEQINTWEKKDTLFPSQPQYSEGAKAKVWLDALEARMPKTASARTGKPAVPPDAKPAP